MMHKRACSGDSGDVKRQCTEEGSVGSSSATSTTSTSSEDEDLCSPLRNNTSIPPEEPHKGSVSPEGAAKEKKRSPSASEHECTPGADSPEMESGKVQAQVSEPYAKDSIPELEQRQLREISHDGTVYLPDPTPVSAVIPYKPIESFPTFYSGDVLVRAELGSEPMFFQLHSSALVRHSSFFANTLKNPRDQNDTSWYSYIISDKGGKPQLRQGVAEGERAVLKSVEEGQSIKQEVAKDDFENNHSLCPPHKDSSSAPFNAYYQVFALFYSIPPLICTKNIGEALLQVEKLVAVSNELGCIQLISPHIDSVLCQYRQKLYIAIKDDPVRWMHLALNLKNKSIYTECFVHLAGAYPTNPWTSSAQSLPPDILGIISKKAGQLNQSCTTANQDLLLATLGVGPRGARVTCKGAQTEMSTWITVQIFRDQLAAGIQETLNTRKGLLRRGSLYRKIYRRDRAFADFETVQQQCLMVRVGGYKDLGEDLGRLKDYASEVVEELVENQLMIDPDAHDIGYLTCVKVEQEDIPWDTDALVGI